MGSPGGSPGATIGTRIYKLFLGYLLSYYRDQIKKRRIWI